MNGRGYLNKKIKKLFKNIYFLTKFTLKGGCQVQEILKKFVKKVLLVNFEIFFLGPTDPKIIFF